LFSSFFGASGEATSFSSFSIVSIFEAKSAAPVFLIFGFSTSTVSSSFSSFDTLTFIF
jgi:hypothetical protein